ncbi:MBL fold metallo-hydrolase [Nocardioides pocheonensis]|nr:MBL fold metallo-hydrolase [Nocardioides pocheonensis]
MSRIRIPFLAAAATVSAALVSPVAGAARGVRRSMGARPPGTYDSPQFRDGLFHNRLPMSVVEPGSTGSMAAEWARRGDIGRPRGVVPLVTPQLPKRATDLAATWLGHATVLLEIGGHWVLTDPVWSERVSPSSAVGPRRNHPVPMPLTDLPPLSAVLISHDHYDHLDTVTIDRLVELQDAPFVVPLGISAHLRRWGVPENRIVELDWGQSHRVGDLTLTCTEARHFSGRGFVRNTTLWSSWVAAAGDRRVFFGGDTGYTPAFAEIGEEHGPFDLTVLPIGAYDRRWRDVHMDPAEAVQCHLDVQGETGGGAILPIHWATFDLAFHRWSAPADWVREEAAERGVVVALPRPGERFEVDPADPESVAGLPTTDWWTAASGRLATS